MQSKHVSLFLFLVVAGIHAGVLAAVVLWPAPPKPVEIVLPTIQGTLVMAEPKEAPPPPPEPPPPPPPPEKKPEPKPKPKPSPKAPPSERAVKAPEPEPPPPVQQPVEPKPAEPAPPAPAPVIPPSSDAEGLNNPAPVVPDMSRRLCEQGTVLFSVLIKADGTIGELKLKTSSGFKRLDSAAKRAVIRWRFQPATQDGVAVDYWYELPIAFSIKNCK